MLIKEALKFQTYYKKVELWNNKLIRAEGAKAIGEALE